MLILIVEDEPICALSTVAELEQAGHKDDWDLPPRSKRASSWRSQCHPALALIDIDLMHAGDGVELAKTPA